MKPRTALLSIVFLLVGAVTSLAHYIAPTAQPPPATHSAPPTTQATASPTPHTPAPNSALDVLTSLPVKGRSPKTGYNREQFGQRWADVDRNGCDTRNDVLARDLEVATFKPGTRDCVVLTGTLHDPYTGKDIQFQRGERSSNEVQIDHVVALSDAWQKGAQQLSIDRRTQFANDPLNLLAVDGRSNQQKGDGDAATWLPANHAFRCEYVARQIAVKHKYQLWVTRAERDAMERILTQCPEQQTPNE